MIFNNIIKKIDCKPFLCYINTFYKMEQRDYSKNTNSQLVSICKEKGLRGYSGKTKSDLIKLLMSVSNTPVVEQTNEIICQIPDCLVDGILKLNNGKDGHGERRIYTGDSQVINKLLCSKPFLLTYSDQYKADIATILDDTSRFSKKVDTRKKQVLDAIDECNSKLMLAQEQNGSKDVRRYYIGPKKDSKENIKLWDLFRKTLIPKEYCLAFVDDGDHFICSIINVKDILTLKKTVSVSNVQMEYFKYIEKMNQIEIQGGHRPGAGEFQLRNPENGYYWPVDGYHNCQAHECNGTKDTPCKWNNHIWEFQGDRYHGNPDKYTSEDMCYNKSYADKWEKDKKKKEFYEGLGYTVNIIWESEWTKQKKEMKLNGQSWL